MIVQPPIRSRNHSKALVNKTSHLNNSVTLQIFVLISIPSIYYCRVFTVVFYILCAFLLLYGL